MGSTDAGTRPRRRLMLGAVAGTGAALGVGAGWFLVSIGTKSNQTYLSVLLGIAVGCAVHAVSRQRGLGPAVVSIAISAAGTVLSFYFVARSALIRRGFIRLTGDDPSIPLRPSYTVVRDVMRNAVRGNISLYVYLLATVVAAGYFGYRGFDSASRAHRP